MMTEKNMLGHEHLPTSLLARIFDRDTPSSESSVLVSLISVRSPHTVNETAHAVCSRFCQENMSVGGQSDVTPRRRCWICSLWSRSIQSVSGSSVEHGFRMLVAVAAQVSASHANRATTALVAVGNGSDEVGDETETIEHVEVIPMCCCAKDWESSTWQRT